MPSRNFYEQDARVIYTVTITEGLQYRMGSLVLSGALDRWRKTHSRGLGYSSRRNSLTRNSTRIFSMPASSALSRNSRHYDKVGRFLQENPGTGRVDVLLDFQ